MGPFAVTDGDDFARLIDKLVPGLAAVGDDIIVAIEDPVREPVTAHELPYVLHGVQFGH